MIAPVNRGRVAILMALCLFLAACASKPAVRGAAGSPTSPAIPTPGPTPSAPSSTQASPPTPAATSASGPGRCHTSQLTLTVEGPTATPTTQYEARLVLTNISAAPCTLTGFPGVELVGDVSNGSKTYDPIRKADTPSKVLVGPGLNAVAPLTALPGPDVCDGATPWVPYEIDVTPPDETTHLESEWPNLSVDNCQGGATHPGTYIGAVQPGNSAPPPLAAGPTGAGPFTGGWYHHGIGVSITASGSGTAEWRTYATCGQDPPPCDTFSGNLIIDGGHATFTVTATSPTTATGQVEVTTDAKTAPVGPMTMTLDPAHHLLYWSDVPATAFCGPQSAPDSPCGA